MELNQDLFNQIHQYLNQEFGTEEHKKFEIQMNQNPALAQAVTTQRRIKSGLKVNDFKQQFINIHSQLKKENVLPIFRENTFADENSIINLKPSNLYSILKYIAIAASLILMIGGGIFIFEKQQMDKHFAQQKIKINSPTPSSKREKSTEIANTKKPIIKTKSIDFNKIYATNFVKIPVIESPFSSEKYGVSPSKIALWESDTVNLKKGIMYLEIGKTQDAINEFNNLAVSRFENIRFHADWYLVLAHLQAKDMVKVKRQLAMIIGNENHIYLENSKKLSKSLK